MTSPAPERVASHPALKKRRIGILPGRKKYTAAVVGGAGTWGCKYLRSYVNRRDCEVVALVDVARGRREEFAAHYGVKHTYDTVEDLLAREVPDIVSAILPVSVTPDVVIACAEAGVKAISCEKPIAVELSTADRMVRVCREHGAALACSTACSSLPHFLDVVRWVQAGNIGRLTAAAIPSGITEQVSGAGCIQLTKMRRLTGMEVEWVEGWTLPPLARPGGPALPGTSELETDCPAFGRLGLSGGIICEIPRRTRDQRVSCHVAVTAEKGQVWICGPCPVIVQGVGANSSPVRPDFFDEPCELHFGPVIDSLVAALETGAELPCSGHDLRQALEIAIALKLSDHRNHQRVHLPLEDRSARIFPMPFRLKGGDLVGWAGGGYTGPPEPEPVDVVWRYAQKK